MLTNKIFIENFNRKHLLYIYLFNPTSQVDLFTGDSSKMNFILFHAVVMMTSWGVLTLVSHYFARYLKFLGRKNFLIHQLINYFVFILTIVGILVPLILSKWKFTFGTHQVLNYNYLPYLIIHLLYIFLLVYSFLL